MLRITSQYFLGLLGFVRPVDIVDGDNGQVTVVTEIAEGDARTGLDTELADLLPGNVEGDRDREKGTISEADILDNSVVLVVRLATCSSGHCQWRRCTHCSPSRS